MIAKNLLSATPKCPVCEGRLSWSFPADYDNEKVLTARYAQSVLVAALGNRALAARVLGIAYRSLVARLNVPLPTRSKRGMRGEERDVVVGQIENAMPLEPVGSPGGCAGTYNAVAQNEIATVYDVRFNEAVVAIEHGDVLEAGDKPMIVFAEADETLRTFAFGEAVPADSLAVVIPVRKLHCMVVVLRRELVG